MNSCTQWILLLEPLLLLDDRSEEPYHILVCEEILYQIALVLYFEMRQIDLLNLLVLGSCARIFNLASGIASLDGLLNQSHMVQKQLLQIICVNNCRRTLELDRLLLQQLLCGLSFFEYQTFEVPQLLLSTRDLVRFEVVVDLSRKHVVTQSKLAHLLQKVLYFHKLKLL